MAKKVLEKIPGKKPRPIEGHKPAAAVLRGKSLGSEEKRRTGWLEFI